MEMVGAILDFFILVLIGFVSVKLLFFMARKVFKPKSQEFDLAEDDPLPDNVIVMEDYLRGKGLR